MFSLTSTHQYYLYSAYGYARRFRFLVRDSTQQIGTGSHMWRSICLFEPVPNQVKLLHWENGGFVIYFKRLENGNFEIPIMKEGQLEWPQLVMMVEGVSLKNITMRKRYLLKKGA